MMNCEGHPQGVFRDYYLINGSTPKTLLLVGYHGRLSDYRTKYIIDMCNCVCIPNERLGHR